MKTISLWNRDLIVTEPQIARLTDYVLDHIAKCPENRQSVSYLVDSIRMDTRFAFPTGKNDAVSVFEALGFKVEHETNRSGSVLRSYVTI